MRCGFRTLDPPVRLTTTLRLSESTMPTLVITGSEDVATPLAAGQIIHDLIPDSILKMLSGAGHVSPCERPAAFDQALLDFLGPAR